MVFGCKQGLRILRMESITIIPQSKHGIMDDGCDHHEEEEEDIGSLSSSTEEEDEDDEGSNNSVASSSSDFMEDASSSGSSSNGPLFEMSSLISQLPFKRGLSKHFEGKSQSFTSLSNVKNLEDLIKPERPFKKRLKSSKSHGWGLDKSLSPKDSSRAITKKSSKGSFSSLNNHMKRHSFLASRPPFPPQRSGSVSSQTLLETIG